MWRNTGLPVRVAMLDARACFPLLFVVLHWTWNALCVAVVGVMFFATISFFGLTVSAVIRLARRFLAGPVRPAVPSWQRRRLA